MKKLLPTLAALIVATPALAHPGAHIHPHAETSLPVLAGLAIIAVAAVVMWRSR
ncbi:MAG: hypothetical protein V2I76_13280 [Roseobacter sp.]|jgi:hypothetical protein|nr:hypothetical protein [Roseobacter sp.]